MAVANTLAYYYTVTIMAERAFKIKAFGAEPKFFYYLLTIICKPDHLITSFQN